MVHFFISGGAGFIGSNIAEKLADSSHKVTVYDNLNTGFYKNIETLSGINFVDGDLLDTDKLHQTLEGVDIVLHQGALGSVPRSIKDPLTSHAANATGTLNLLIQANSHKVKRFVYASSSSVYGNTPELPKHEDMPTNPKSPYSAQKLLGENYTRIFADIYGLETVSLRYFNVFGPRQNPDSQYSAVIPIFIKKIINDEEPIIFGDGTQSRDFTFVANNVHANLLAATTTSPEAIGNVFNIATGGRVTLNELVEGINSILGKNIEPKYQQERTGDVMHSQADISRAQQVLDYKIQVDFKTGLEKTVEYYQKLLS